MTTRARFKSRNGFFRIIQAPRDDTACVLLFYPGFLYAPPLYQPISASTQASTTRPAHDDDGVSVFLIVSASLPSMG